MIAKKMLNKMDALAKLHHCMLKVADEVLKARNTVRHSRPLDILHTLHTFSNS